MPLVLPLAAPLGGDPITPSIVPPPSLAQVDHVERGIDRLPSQFRGKVKTETLLRILLKPFNDLEVALQQLLLERTVNTAIGAQLDVLGKLVGQDREGLNDDDYRRYIRARILTNRSNGTHEILIRIVHLVLNDPAALVNITGQRGTVAVQLISVITSDEVADIVLEFAQQAVESGIRVFVESYPDTDDNLFTMAQTFFSLSSIGVGDTTLFANESYASTSDLASFPSIGDLIIDEGTSSEETVTLSSRNGNKFFVSACTKTHLIDAPVTLTGSNAKGKGWGDASESGNPVLIPYQDTGTTGGRMADARG